MFTRTTLRRLAAAVAAIGVPNISAQQRGQFFQQADANGDGFVTRQELKAAMANWLAGNSSAAKDQFTRGLEASFPESAFLVMISPPPSRTTQFIR